MQGKEEEDKVKYNCLTNESMVFEREGRSICSFGGKNIYLVQIIIKI